MELQNWYGKLFSRDESKGHVSAFVGMDDRAYRAFLRRKENRSKAIADMVREIDEFGTQTSYYMNDNGILQLVHMAQSYQLCFYCGDTAVTYVINTDMPVEAFGEKVAFWQSILIGTDISLTVLGQPLREGAFRHVIWAMDGNLKDCLEKLPFENL